MPSALRRTRPRAMIQWTLPSGHRIRYRVHSCRRGDRLLYGLARLFAILGDNRRDQLAEGKLASGGNPKLALHRAEQERSISGKVRSRTHLAGLLRQLEPFLTPAHRLVELGPLQGLGAEIATVAMKRRSSSRRCGRWERPGRGRRSCALRPARGDRPRPGRRLWRARGGDVGSALSAPPRWTRGLARRCERPRPPASDRPAAVVVPIARSRARTPARPRSRSSRAGAVDQEDIAGVGAECGHGALDDRRADALRIERGRERSGQLLQLSGALFTPRALSDVRGDARATTTSPYQSRKMWMPDQTSALAAVSVAGDDIRPA